MPPTNLWKIPRAAENVRTPTIALKEQASLLSTLTDRILEAQVTRFALTSIGKISVSLLVKAPALRGYTIEVLELTHDMFGAYPSLVESSINDIEQEVYSEIELMAVVEEILHSEEMSKILNSLLSESQSETG